MALMLRKVKRIVTGTAQVDGAGVELIRVIGKPDVEDFDPFLMLDAFDHDDPSKYTKGFPWHPHRGIETVTYLLEGEIEHGDSLDNRGIIRNGDCQWMTAGSGIIHQEMPQAQPKMLGVQLWVNLPARQKMTTPRYRDFTRADIPAVAEKGHTIRIISGSYRGVKGPMEEIAVQPTFLEVNVEAGETLSYKTEPDNTLFIYILKGSAALPADDEKVVKARHAMLFDAGDELKLSAGGEGLLMLLFSGKPLREPIAWGGPIVMNTREELSQAFKEIDAGTFIKEHGSDGKITGSRVNQGYYQ
jgi:quercetin 2,3-dioxygenase